MNEYIYNIKTNLERALNVPIYCTVHEDLSKQYITLEVSTVNKSQLTKEQQNNHIETLKHSTDIDMVCEFEFDYFYITKLNKEEYWTKEKALRDQLEIIENMLAEDVK